MCQFYENETKRTDCRPTISVNMDRQDDVKITTDVVVVDNKDKPCE